MTQADDRAKDAAETDAGEQLVVISPDASSSPKDFLLWAGVIVLAVLTVYSPALRGKFLWDDDRHVSENRNLRDADGLANIWTRFGLRHGGTPQYYPLTHTTYWIEYQLTGATPGEINPTIFHVTNAVLHAGAAILLWFVLRELAVPGAWVAAAIFALHPVNVESVAWISERKNVLAAVFFFGSVLAYLKTAIGYRVSGMEEHARHPTPDTRYPSFYILSLALFILGLLSKTVVCSLPAVILVLTWWKRGRLTWRDITPTIPFFVIGLGMAWLTSRIEMNEVIRTAEGFIGPEWKLSPTQRLIIAGRAIWFYAFKLVWPAKLSFIYPKWDIDPAQPMQWVFPIAAVAVLLALILLRRKIGRGVVAAALIYVGVLVPALGFFNVYPMRYSYVADHFQYLAEPALIALIIAFVARLLQRVRLPALPYALAGIVLVVLAVLTLLQSRIYASQLTLWRDTVAKNPSSWMARNNVGQALYQEVFTLPGDQVEQAQKMLDEAAEDLRKAVELKPDHARALMTWGQVLLLQNKPQDALDKFNAALALDPANVDAWAARATALERLNKPDEAADSYRRGVAEANARRGVWPRITVAALHQHIADIAKAKGDLTTARQALEQALVVAPNSSSVHQDYAKLLAQQGDKSKAAEEFAKAIYLDPMNLDAHLDLAELRLEVGNAKGAYSEWREAGGVVVQNPDAVTPAQSARMVALFQKWQAATQPSTTQSATAPATTRGGR